MRGAAYSLTTTWSILCLYKINPKKIKWEKHEGYSIVQGTGKVSGRLFVMMPGPMNQIMGTKYYPSKEYLDGAILAIEHGKPYGDALAGFHNLRAFAASGHLSSHP